MKSPIPAIWLYSLLVGLVVILVVSYAFHWQAGISIIPFLLILCCPLMMLMMGGHGDGNHSTHTTKHDDHHE